MNYKEIKINLVQCKFCSRLNGFHQINCPKRNINTDKNNLKLAIPDPFKKVSPRQA